MTQYWIFRDLRLLATFNRNIYKYLKLLYLGQLIGSLVLFYVKNLKNISYKAFTEILKQSQKLIFFEAS